MFAEMHPPHAALNDGQLRRYMRQTVIAPFGTPGQVRLLHAHVLVIGAGGLGSPVLAYLAAAGIGTLTIADGDRVSVSNLNRQIVHRTSDEGRLKSERAAEFVAALNPGVQVTTHGYVSGAELPALAGAADVVVDGSDNLDTRRAVAAAALGAGKPLVTGAVGQLEGYVAVFPAVGVGLPAGFEALFPPGPEPVRCEASGTIGAVTGVIGSLMAMETIKVISGLGRPLVRRAIHYDAKEASFSTIDLVVGAKICAIVGG